MADNFLLSLVSSLAQSAEVAGLEQALETRYAKHPEKWNQTATICLAFAGLVGELEADTKSPFLKKLEEGLITAVNYETAKHPPVS